MTLSRRDWKDATTLVAAPLTSGGHPNSNAPGRRKEDDENLVAFHPTQDPIHGQISHALGSEESGSVAIAFASKAGGGGSYREDGLSPTLSAHGDSEGGAPPAVTNGASVRRLTPTECQRLQALPDDWFDGVPASTDSKKYAGLGDAVTVTVAEWIGSRIAAAL